MADSPTQRTLKAARAAGHTAAVAEYWNPHGGARRWDVLQRKHVAVGNRVDLFGFIDVVVLRPGEIVGVQACAGTDASKRKRKIVTECREKAAAWLQAGGLIEVWAWKKYAKPEAGKWWRARVESVTLADVEEQCDG